MITEHDLPRVRRLDVLYGRSEMQPLPLPESDKWPMWATIWCALGASWVVLILLGIGFLAGRLSLWLWP